MRFASLLGTLTLVGTLGATTNTLVGFDEGSVHLHSPLQKFSPVAEAMAEAGIASRCSNEAGPHRYVPARDSVCRTGATSRQ